MSLLIGVDLGTTETKAGLFDTDGNLRHLARAGYAILSGPQPGAAEQDPLAWWSAVRQTLREIAQSAPPSHLAALCVEGQGPSVVMTDEQGRPLHNALLWMDTRIQGQSQELSYRLGQAVSPFAHVPMAMWLKQNRRSAFQSARWFLAAWDFVAFRLCGQPAASTLATYQPFPAAEVAAAHLPPRMFPELVPAGQAIGVLTEEAASETGLPAGLPVVAGTHDGMATFVGAGLFKPGRAADVNGTSGGLAVCWCTPINRPGIFSTPWIHEHEYIVGGAMATLGKCLDWARESILGEGISRSDFALLASTAPAGCDGLIFLPYLAGERAPIWDPKARGVFFGLTLKHGRAHLARAVLEAVAFALRHVADEVTAAGVRIEEMRVCGGQAQSQIWNQIKSDVTGLAVAVPRVREAALMGAAVLAGLGAGLLPDIRQGAHQMVGITEVLWPDAGRQARYTEQYGMYRRLYADLKGAFEQLSAIQGTREEAP